MHHAKFSVLRNTALSVSKTCMNQKITGSLKKWCTWIGFIMRRIVGWNVTRRSGRWATGRTEITSVFRVIRRSGPVVWHANVTLRCPLASWVTWRNTERGARINFREDNAVNRNSPFFLDLISKIYCFSAKCRDFATIYFVIFPIILQFQFIIIFNVQRSRSDKRWFQNDTVILNRKECSGQNALTSHKNILMWRQWQNETVYKA